MQRFIEILIVIGILTLGEFTWVQARGGIRAPNRAAIEEGYIAAPDGPRLYFQKSGSGPVVIAPGRLFLFDSFLQLGDHYTIISYDMRDRGRSDAVADGTKLTIQDDVRDLETVRKHFGASNFTPVGYSYLGLMVVLYAMDYPGHVERLVQMGPVAMKYDTKFSPDQMADDRDKVPDPVEIAKLEKLEKERYNARHPKEFCEMMWAVERFMLVGDPVNVDKLGKGWCDLPNEWPVHLDRHFEYSFVSIQKLEVTKEAVAKVQVPVLTIHGRRDRNAPYGSGREWAATLPNARLLTIRGAAHQSFVEYPEVVFPAIRTFLAGGWPAAAEKITAK